MRRVYQTTSSIAQYASVCDAALPELVGADVADVRAIPLEGLWRR